MHTEGDWTIEKRDGHSPGGVRPVITAKGVDRIAVVSYRGVPSIAEADANALLIAAAPKLLAACEEADKALNKCLRYFLGTGPQPDPEQLSDAPIMLKAAIAEAKGA